MKPPGIYATRILHCSWFHAVDRVAAGSQKCADKIKIVDIEGKIKLNKKSPLGDKKQRLTFAGIWGKMRVQ
jgi:hypothetical protein